MSIKKMYPLEANKIINYNCFYLKTDNPNK